MEQEQSSGATTSECIGISRNSDDDNPMVERHDEDNNTTTTTMAEIPFSSVHGSLMLHLDYYKALSNGSAMKYVVTKQFQSHNVNQECVTDLDAMLHTLIAYVSLSHSKLENEKFAQLLKLINIKNNLKVQTLIDERNFYR